MKPLLPEIQDRVHYNQIFREDTHWEKAIHFLIQKHQLKGDVKRSGSGSHIVYRVGDAWIKLMAPIFEKEMPYEISGLRTIEGRLSVDTPRIIFEGEIESWKYVILSHVEGESIRETWKSFSIAQKLKLAEQIAFIIKQIAACKPDQVIRDRYNWNNFIQEQYENIEAQQKKKDLPEAWLKQVKSFVQQFNLSEFKTENQIFLHADLTFDHFLVSVKDEPKITAIIDLADCQVGHFMYEFLAPAFFIFRSQKEVLRHFFLAYGFSEKDLNSELSNKLFVWTLLHRYCAIKHHLKEDMESCKPGDFVALAQKIYPL